MEQLGSPDWIVPWDTAENGFFSFSQNTKVLMLSTYTSQKPVTLRQPPHHMKHVGMWYGSTYMHPPTYRKEAEPWRTSEPEHWFPLFGWHHWFTICCWKPPCLEAFPRFLASLLRKLGEDRLFSGDPQNKMFHNWFCWELIQLHAL